VVSRRDFLPFGEEIQSGTGGRNSAQGYGGQDNIRQKFTGYERDAETDLDFAQARMYQSKLGRFTSTDPIFIQAGMLPDPQRFNLYVYVRNNPNKFVDTDGEILRLSGDLTFLRGMIDQWGGDFKDKITVADDGTVTFNVKPEDIKGNEAAQFLYDLVNDAETILFYAGNDADKAGSFVEENKDSKSFSRDQLKKQFTGEAYAAGGGYFVATRNRVADNGGAATGTPTEGIFAVIAFNTDANFFEIQGVSDTDSTRDKKKDHADLAVPLAAFYIHEGAETLDFARQKREGSTINQSAYRTAHNAAITRENKIREQINMIGGKAGGSIRSVAPKNKK
jgi:RHS repeat-associated protein